MTVRVYRSTDSGAPVLTGLAGSLVAVLSACLVTGYGAQAAAGWGEPFSVANKSVYRAAAGNRCYLRVDDTSGAVARVIGYRSMSGVDTGDGAFPLEAVISGGLYLFKSNSATSAARGWVLIANEEICYFLPHATNSDWLTASAYTDSPGHMAFGEFVSHKAGDLYNTVIIAAGGSAQSVGTLGIQHNAGSSFGAASGHYLARNYTALGDSIQCNKRALMDQSTSSIIGAGSGYAAFPDPVTGGMMISPVAVLEPDGTSDPVIRGIMPGMWAPLHLTPGNHGDTIVGSGALAGKTFLLVLTVNGTTVGRTLFEISDTW